MMLKNIEALVKDGFLQLPVLDPVDSGDIVEHGG
jgi:hypothetical protein